MKQNTIKSKIQNYLESQNHIDETFDYFKQSFDIETNVDIFDIYGAWNECYDDFCKQNNITQNSNNEKMFEKMYREQHNKLYKQWKQNNGIKTKKHEQFTTWTNYYKNMKHDKLDVEIEKLIEKTLENKIEKFWRSKFWTNHIDSIIKNTNKIRLHDENYGLGFCHPIDIYERFCEQNPTTFCSVEFFAKRYEQKTNEILQKWLNDIQK